MTKESVVKRLPRYGAYLFEGTRGSGIDIVNRLNKIPLFTAELKQAEVNGISIPDAYYISGSVVSSPFVVVKDTWVVFGGESPDFLNQDEYETKYRKASSND